MDGKLGDSGIKVRWVGSRSGKATDFTVGDDTLVKDFVMHVFYNYHHDLETHEYSDELDYTNAHNVMLKPSNKILDIEKSFAENKITPHDIPYDITFVTGLKSGMGKRATTLVFILNGFLFSNL